MEDQIVSNAKYYKANGKSQENSESGEFLSWYQEIHLHFQNSLLQRIQKYQEYFVEYFPVKFLFGEASTVKQGAFDDRIYRYTFGTYGTGYICFTEKNMYITSLDLITKKYPLYPSGAKRFLWDLLNATTGERNERKPYHGDKTWMVEYSSIVGTQITRVESNVQDLILLKTKSINWEIFEHFTNTLPQILAILKMGMTGELSNILTGPSTKQTDVPNLLKKLYELKEAGIIAETEFQEKKKRLMNFL